MRTEDVARLAVCIPGPAARSRAGPLRVAFVRGARGALGHTALQWGAALPCLQFNSYGCRKKPNKQLADTQGCACLVLPPLQAWARDEHPLGQLLSRALQPGENTPRSMPRRQGAKPFVNGDKICESTLSIKEGAAGQAHRPAQNASRAWEGTAILNTKLIPPPLLVIVHTSPISKKKSWEVVTKSPKNLTHLPHAMHLPWARLLHSLRLAPHQTPEALCPNS